MNVWKRDNRTPDSLFSQCAILRDVALSTLPHPSMTMKLLLHACFRGLGLPATLILLLAACDAPPVQQTATTAERPVLATRADSVALMVYDAVGGPSAWASVPYLRFDFATGNDTVRQVRARHLWNRQNGDYRLEMNAGEDTVYVALFNVHTREGNVYLNGQPVDSTRRAEWLERAYGRFINDTYWLLAPTKLFDPGVTRAYVPDSSTADTEVITLTFDDVGLTPGDRYWIYADRATGRMERWAYRLQSYEPDAAPTSLAWEGYESFEAPAGPVHLATRKDGTNFSIYTDNIALPAEVPADLFTDPNPSAF